MSETTHVNASASLNQDPGQGWTMGAPRDEIRPKFAVDAGGGPGGKAAYIIEADGREVLHGWWSRTFDVTGGSYAHFSALYRARHVETPRRSVLVKIDWRDEQGQAVADDRPTVTGYLTKMTRMAETEHP